MNKREKEALTVMLNALIFVLECEKEDKALTESEVRNAFKSVQTVARIALKRTFNLPSTLLNSTSNHGK